MRALRISGFGGDPKTKILQLPSFNLNIVLDQVSIMFRHHKTGKRIFFTKPSSVVQKSPEKPGIWLRGKAYHAPDYGSSMEHTDHITCIHNPTTSFCNPFLQVSGLQEPQILKATNKLKSGNSILQSAKMYPPH